MATGRMCEKHGRYCADGVCPYCEPVLPVVETVVEENPMAIDTSLKFEMPLPDPSMFERIRAVMEKYPTLHEPGHGRRREIRSLLPGEHGHVPDELQVLGLTDPVVSRFVNEMRGYIRVWGPNCAIALISALAEEKRKLYKIAVDATSRFIAGPAVLTPSEPPLTSEETRLLNAYRKAVENGLPEIRWFLPYDAKFR